MFDSPVVAINWINQELIEILLASQIDFVLPYSDKTDLFLSFNTWLLINHACVRKKKNIRVSHFNPTHANMLNSSIPQHDEITEAENFYKGRNFSQKPAPAKKIFKKGKKKKNIFAIRGKNPSYFSARVKT